jgi:hypothetical protein
MTGPACLGGWCSKRVGCPNYEVTGKARKSEPAERLCLKGQDGRRRNDEQALIWQRDFVPMGIAAKTGEQE